jgi:hypothetical protein
MIGNVARLDADQIAPKPRLGPPRIFVEVRREVEGGDRAIWTRREIDVAVYRRARISVSDAAIDECLAEAEQYGR